VRQGEHAEGKSIEEAGTIESAALRFRPDPDDRSFAFIKGVSPVMRASGRRRGRRTFMGTAVGFFGMLVADEARYV